MRNCLDLPSLQRLSRAVCRKNNVTPPSGKELREMYYSPIPQPIQRQSPEAKVWIDKYYIAFSRGSEPIRYPYLTRCHIEEEQRSLADLQAERNLTLCLPKEIDRLFREAAARMDLSHTQYLCDRSTL